MSLRARLVLVLVSLVAAGLLVAGIVTYTALRSFLMQRVDQQLESAVAPMAASLRASLGVVDSTGVDRGPGRIPVQLPPGTFGELRDSAGVVVEHVQFNYGDVTIPAPALPAGLPAAYGGEAGPVVFSVGAVGASSPRFRVRAQPLTSTGGTLLVAVPLSDVSQTLHRLLLVEIPLTILVLLGLAALAWWTVRRGLRPLEDMGVTAGAIAAGDLSRRVDMQDPRTEVGRLGLALNTMLVQIEEAFAERRASEERLRRFLADASHELRTPLTSIRGYAELFRRGANRRPDDLAASMRRIEGEAARMGVLVDELLLLARLDHARALRMEPVDLVRVVDDAVTDARAADPSRAITLQAPDTAVLSGDEDRLRQLVSNLLSNALTHTPAGSSVEVEVRVTADEAVLCVADHGPGLPPESADRVFEAFYRLDEARGRSSGGAGLGLAIVSAVATAHGGSAEVQSTFGDGAVFRVHLPLAGSSD